MNHARRIARGRAALEAAVPVTVDIAQTHGVAAIAAHLPAVVPGGAPGGEESDDGVVGGLDDRAVSW